VSRVTALAGRRPGTPGRRPPRNPAGISRRPAPRQTLNLAEMLWRQGTTLNRVLTNVQSEGRAA
jgi:hypothetical protein